MILENDIESGRIRLSQFTERDISNIYLGWLADVNINKYLEVRFTEFNEVRAKEYIRRCIDSPNIFFLKIISREGKFIGTCTVNHNTFHKTAEIGLMIGDSNFHGRGLGSEVIGLLVRLCCSQLFVRKVSAGLYSSNKPSLKAFLKNGFIIESKLSSEVLLEGKPEDTYRLSYYCKDN